jgi:hypothetical protein
LSARRRAQADEASPSEEVNLNDVSPEDLDKYIQPEGPNDLKDPPGAMGPVSPSGPSQPTKPSGPSSFDED